MSRNMGHEPGRDRHPGHDPGRVRVRLPIAPRAQARIRFEPDRPLPRALTPDQAMTWLDYLFGQGRRVEVVNLSGPGDPLATPEPTLRTLSALREKYPGLSLCLTTLGLGAAGMAGRLAGLSLAHVSLLMDAVDPQAAEKIYAWIRPGTRNLPLGEAARLLVAEQASALAALAEQKIPVLVRTTIYPGVNSGQIIEIASRAADLGAGGMKLLPFEDPGGDHPLQAAGLEPADPKELAGPKELAEGAGAYLPVEVLDPASCREAVTWDPADPDQAWAGLPRPDPKRPNLAVCSSDGFQVDLHLGQAERYLIYGPKDGLVALLETRPAPEPGGGELRWQKVGLILGDCFAVLAAAAGKAPRRILAERNIAVVDRSGNLEELTDRLFGGGKKGGGR